MDPTRFDNLTKAMATPASRRQALRRIGGTLTGVTLASLLPGHALADNSACAHFCDSVFGADTPAASQCISDAAHQTGLCYSACGPSGAGGRLCGSPGSYTSLTCCPNFQSACCNGSCFPVSSPDFTCCADGSCCNLVTSTCCPNPHGTCCNVSAGFTCCSDGSCQPIGTTC